MAVINGGLEAVNTFLYGLPTQVSLDAIKQSYERVANAATGYTNSFIESSKAMMDRAMDSEAIERAKQLLFAHTVEHNPNTITAYAEEFLYKANPYNQSYMMAYDYLTTLAEQGAIHGFNSTYTPMVKVDKPEDNPLYMDVMDGVISSEMLEKDLIFYQHSYETPELDEYEKFSVLDNWMRAKLRHIAGYDPTDNVTD